jgi:hypothetical protein
MVAAVLPTPQAYEADHGGSQHPDQRAGHQVYLSDVVERALMPTPVRADGERSSATYQREGSPTSQGVAAGLMPTPRASDGPKGGPNARGSSGDLMMGAVAARLPAPFDRLPTPTTNRAPVNSEGLPLLPYIARNLPTPAARDWKSGQSNIMDRNARPLNEIVETGLPTPKASDANGGPWQGPSRQGSDDLRTAASLLPTPTTSDGQAGNANRSGPRSSELLLAGVTRAMLRQISSGEWTTTTTRKRSKRGKRSPAGQHPCQLSLTDAETGGSTPGSVSG